MIPNQELELNGNLSDSDNGKNSSDIFFKQKRKSSTKMTSNSESSDEGSGPAVSRLKKRIQRFSDSESNSEKEDSSDKKKHEDSEKESPKKNTTNKSNTSSNDSDTDDKKSIKNEEQQLRMKNKRNKLRNKFKSLVTSRSKETPKSDSDSDNGNKNNNSDEADDNESSINNIKQIIKKSMAFKPSICDPDTSDEEENDSKTERLMSKPLNQKRTKPTSPKPMRMTAKQAMENMQKIKSESNRLLREKEVTLPYHRPKAFSLKDIMSRRKPAVSSDGKALPIKMNEEQLRQYAQMLEQRQKEIMDLCKSDSEEEQEKPKEPSTDVDIATNTVANKENKSTDVQHDITTDEAENAHKVHEVSNLIDLNSHETPELHDDPNVVVEKESSLDGVLGPSFNNHNFNTKSVEESDSLEKLVMVTENKVTNEDVLQQMDITEQSADEDIEKISTEPDSQVINLHFDSENTVVEKVCDNNTKDISLDTPKDDEKPFENDFSEDDIDMDDIDKLIENAVINETTEHTEHSSIEGVGAVPLDMKPILAGAPGMVIDLDDSESAPSKRLSGVELLKERFSYFSRLKTPEELEREREKKLKPGAQHLKLKHELEEIIAEQRSVEWAKRLNEEKQQQIELKAFRGEESEAEDDIEKIEAQIKEKDVECEDTSEGESEPEEDDIEIQDKPRSANPMIDDEAEESDCDDEDIKETQTESKDIDNDEENDKNYEEAASSEEESSEESSDEDPEEETTKARKGRILKAFEDSDDETGNEAQRETASDVLAANVIEEKEKNYVKTNVNITETQVKEVPVNNEMEVDGEVESQILKDSQDDEIQLAQRMVSGSDDMFTSQENTSVICNRNTQGNNDENIGTQSFSILNSRDIGSNLDGNLDASINICPENIPLSLIPSHLTSSQPIDQSQAIGEDVLALCTGNFYDNQFISQTEENNKQEAVNDNFDDSWSKGESQEDEINNVMDKTETPKDNVEEKDELKDNTTDGKVTKVIDADHNFLQSIIDELHDEKTEPSKSNKFFASKNANSDNNQLKKKFVIESDDEFNEDTSEQKKKKKLKKKKLEQRALQISDDEEDELGEEEDYLSEPEIDGERIVEYDSEENEIEVKQQNPKKKRKVADFFENEAELTSEDEWAGSGDEDEAGLDRMEREEGDDDKFHHEQLQRELGQIHMRDVLDQDKREVRIIQELLFEDGDLGDGHRQRKFRWRNAEGEEEPDTVVDEFADTQEEEFESEEQWRKQRHEREVFLRQMKEQDKTEDVPSITLNRSAIIKANLTSKPISNLLLEVSNTSMKTDKIENSIIKEKLIKDIPSPKKGFAILQQNYHSSLLTRGRGALARLAALATPLAVDDDSTKVAAVAPKDRRNFVFTAVAKNDEPKVMKRKAESKLDTPRLVKKLKTNEKKTLNRNSLLDHLNI